MARIQALRHASPGVFVGQIVSVVALFVLGHSLQAQDKPTISVDVKVVTLPVTVRDKHGQIIKDLTKADFSLQEDGRPQSIRYFNQETNLPLTLGLLVDTSLSQRNVLDQERTASRSYFAGPGRGIRCALELGRAIARWRGQG